MILATLPFTDAFLLFAYVIVKELLSDSFDVPSGRKLPNCFSVKVISSPVYSTLLVALNASFALVTKPRSVPLANFAALALKFFFVTTKSAYTVFVTLAGSVLSKDLIIIASLYVPTAAYLATSSFKLTLTLLPNLSAVIDFPSAPVKVIRLGLTENPAFMSATLYVTFNLAVPLLKSRVLILALLSVNVITGSALKSKLPVLFKASASKVTSIPFSPILLPLVLTFFTGNVISVSLILTETASLSNSIADPVYSPASLLFTVTSFSSHCEVRSFCLTILYSPVIVPAYPVFSAVAAFNVPVTVTVPTLEPSHPDQLQSKSALSIPLGRLFTAVGTF